MKNEKEEKNNRLFLYHICVQKKPCHKSTHKHSYTHRRRLHHHMLKFEWCWLSYVSINWSSYWSIGIDFALQIEALGTGLMVTTGIKQQSCWMRDLANYREVMKRFPQIDLLAEETLPKDFFLNLKPGWNVFWNAMLNVCNSVFFPLVNVILYIFTPKLQIRKERYERKRSMENGDDMPQGQRLHSASTVDAYLILITTLYNNRCFHYLDFV